MIVDNIKNAKLYYGLGEGFKAALGFLEGYNGKADEKADIIVNEAVMVKCRPYMTKPEEQCGFEAHDKYADIHFVVSGNECIGYAQRDSLSVKEIDESKDMIYLEGEGLNIPLNAGDFMITFPQDAHMPCVIQSESVLCCKLIAKVKL